MNPSHNQSPDAMKPITLPGFVPPKRSRRAGVFWLLPVMALSCFDARLHAGPRSSASYHVATDTADAGGRRATSANYTHDGSLGGIAGLSTVASPAETAKHGYIGQLYDVTGLVLSATPTTVNEGATLQLSAGQLLDDATSLGLPATAVTWSVAAGPLTGINASGLATAGIVYQNTAATAQGNYTTFTSTLALTVLNVNLDDLPGYAVDQIDDAWQVQYFGLPPNANAGSTVDFSGTGQTNLFKFVAGLNPLDGSRFTLSIAPVPAKPSQKYLIFSPIVPGRIYTVKSKPDLSALTWDPVTVSPPADVGMERTVTDTGATGATKFYHIEITKL